MTDSNTAAAVAPRGSALSTAINILTAPTEAFRELEHYPTKLVPLALVLLSSMAVMFWYFSIVDFDWYVDDILRLNANMTAEQLEAARDSMLAMSQSTFRTFGVLGSAAGMLAIYVLQAGYLSMASALNGDKYRFGHWFSLVCWTNLPYLLTILGMIVTILLSPNGQLSAFDLNPLTLANLGMQSSDGAVQNVMNTVSLTMLWSIALLVLGYRSWLQASWGKTLAIVITPYLLIIGVWTYLFFA